MVYHKELWKSSIAKQNRKYTRLIKKKKDGNTKKKQKKTCMYKVVLHPPENTPPPFNSRQGPDWEGGL